MWMLQVLIIGLSIFMIQPSKATKVCSCNEVYDPCIKVCPPQVCGVDPALILCAPQKDCSPGYRCRDGYVRNKNGVCIPKEKCPPNPIQCGINEIYEECVSTCPPRFCGVQIAAISCTPSPNPGDPGCTPGCRCRDGTLRNANGVCIPEELCPTCPENEVYDVCPAPCPPRKCDVDDRAIRCPAPPKFGDPTCVPGCRCADGYYRNSNYKCVTRDQCSPICGINEIYSNCTNSGCGPKTCSSIGYPIGCIKMDPKNCKEGCVCKDGYVRDDNENCIAKNKCPSCGGDPHAVSGCGVNCGRHCNDYNTGPVACPAVCNDNGCDCVKGYVYDDNVQQCVLPKDCTPICGTNEVFSDCINGGCNAKNCTQYGKPVPCVRPQKCQPGCLCKDGYLRTEIGICVPQEQCTGKCYKPNEVYNPCIQICPPQTCESIGKIFFCPRQSTNCTGGCRCKEGYYRNKIGDCISSDECKLCPGPHEYFACGGACDNVCATLQQQNQTNCPIVNIKCNDMCYCEEGYARDANNICIPIKNCPVTPPKCCDGEIYEPCPDNLCTPQKCSQLGFPINCPSNSSAPCPGAPGCVCADGKVRDQNGRCVTRDQCPSCGGDPNAQSGCGVCDKTCANPNGPVICPRICFPNACNCKPGFVRDTNINRCVLLQQCTPVCKANEVYSDCINGGCQAKNCSQLGQPIPCPKIDPKYCIKGCLCQDGYLRASNGTCVPTDQCDNCKKPNEVYNACAQSCPAQICENINKTNIECPIVAQVCRGACECIPGYYRNKIGDCISKQDCLKCTGPHEFFSCGGACDNVCATLKEQNQTNCPIINIKCNPMCYCEEGYARDNNNICVPISQCPVKCPKPHQVYSKCPPICPPQTCESINKTYNCPAIIIGDTSNCKPGCICENGYLKNAIDECISKEDCLKCTGPNEYFSCGGACDNVCATLKEQNKTNCPIVNIKCNPMCYCLDGYARDNNNICVPISKCPPVKCTKPHEVYSKCPIICPPQTCDSFNKSYSCPAQVIGKPACVCEDGYYRNAIGECISKADCLKCTGPNEYFSCDGACDNVCATLKEQNKTNCPIVNIVCNPMCYCLDGYARDNNNICVPISKCPPAPICRKNEVYDSCANGGCKKRNCSEYSGPTICRDPIKCIGGCVCRDGYLRSECGTCIPQEQCPIQCTKPHEVYSKCPPTCPPQTCESINHVFSCPAIIIGDTSNCKPGCVCENGYYRNAIGECISKDDCLKCTGPNEYFSCDGACDNVCATLKEQNKTNCPIVNIVCNPMCYCLDGYARDNNNTCVPINQCPPPPVCPKGEILESCSQVVCQPKTCAELGFPLDCPTNGTCKGPRKCICDNNNVRDAKGKCVDRSACPSCGGDINARSGCGVNCGRLCSNYKKKNVACPLICNLNGCDCKDGFVLDDNTNRCVRPDQCTPKCGRFEVYDGCANGGCNKRNCSQLRQPTLCIDPIKCKGGCVCQKGYLRAKNGTCVPASQCPDGCPKNEQYSDCPYSTCTAQTCDELGFPVFCPASNSSCSEDPGCICKDGYVRNSNGDCVPKKQCPSCGGDPNAESGCGVNCGRHCSNYNKGPVPCPKICNLNGCDCKQGYVYDDNVKLCVLPKNCTPVCGSNEVYDSCSNKGCSKRNCTELGEDTVCRKAKNCVGSCVCQDGYLRAPNGSCVPQNQCPVKCSGPNEYFACGGACDNVCATLKTQNQTNCPIINIKCNDKCYCDKGYARDDNNICIPISQCGLSCNGDTNAVPGCGTYCGNSCTDYNEKIVACPDICIVGGCDCKENYVYDENIKKCVQPKDCSKPKDPCTNMTTTPPPVVNKTDAEARFNQACNKMSGDFVYQMNQNNPNTNSAVSAASVLIALAQLALVATGLVLEQLLKALGLKNQDEIHAIFPELLDNYQDQRNVTLEIASKYYANINYELSQNFIDQSLKYFRSVGENVDFSQNVQAANIINDWVKNATHGKILNLISPSALSAGTRLVLVNALYFMGDWLHTFNINDTQTKDFYSCNKTVSVDMMYQENSFEYYEDDTIQALNLPYIGGNFSCLIILPKDQCGLPATIDSFRNGDKITTVLNEMTRQKVQVSLPKMTIETSLDMGAMLQKDNVTAMFDPNTNGLQGILKKNESISVTGVVQKVFVGIDEKGTVAAAATGIIVGTTAVFEPPKIYVFDASHPFIYCILIDVLDNSLCLFIGTFVGSS